MLPHRLLSTYPNQTNPNKSDRDTLSHSLILQQEPEFGRGPVEVMTVIFVVSFFIIMM